MASIREAGSRFTRNGEVIQIEALRYRTPFSRDPEAGGNPKVTGMEEIHNNGVMALP